MKENRIRLDGLSTTKISLVKQYMKFVVQYELASL